MKFIGTLLITLILSANTFAQETQDTGRTSKTFFNCSNASLNTNAPRVDIAGLFKDSNTLARVESYFYFGSGILITEKFKDLAAITPEAREFKAPGSVVFDVGSINAWGNIELYIPLTALAKATGEKSKKIPFTTSVVDWNVDGDYYGEKADELSCYLSYEVTPL